MLEFFIVSAGVCGILTLCLVMVALITHAFGFEGFADVMAVIVMICYVATMLSCTGAGLSFFVAAVT